MSESLHYQRITRIFPTLIFILTSSDYLEFSIPRGEFFLMKRFGYFAFFFYWLVLLIVFFSRKWKLSFIKDKVWVFNLMQQMCKYMLTHY